MPFIETAMRAMTHLNIGAAIAMLAWILWSGHLILSGEAPVAARKATNAAQLQSFSPAMAHPRVEVKP